MVENAIDLLERLVYQKELELCLIEVELVLLVGEVVDAVFHDLHHNHAVTREVDGNPHMNMLHKVLSSYLNWI